MWKCIKKNQKYQYNNHKNNEISIIIMWNNEYQKISISIWNVNNNINNEINKYQYNNNKSWYDVNIEYNQWKKWNMKIKQ